MPGQEENLKELARIRERCLSEIRRLREELRVEIEPAAVGDEDSADAAVDVCERSRIIFLIESQQAKLRALDHAIASAKKGTYGICEACGQPIPEERLKMVPETTLCMQCARKMEQRMRRRRLRIHDGVGPRRRPRLPEEQSGQGLADT